jgi:hypothetical protein
MRNRVRLERGNVEALELELGSMRMLLELEGAGNLEGRLRW